MPLISVIIPVYNVAQWLPTCIESLLTQDYTDYEIILVDDGSTDGQSGAICDAYAQQHPQRIQVVHKENGGLGDARNAGIARSSGEYLFFVDSDDFVAPHTLADLAQQIARYHSDVYLFGMVINRDGVPGETLLDDLPKNQVFCLEEQPTLLLVAPTACCRLWKRDLFMQSGIRFPARVWYEDIRTTLKLYTLAKTVVCLDKAYYYYLVRANSIMQSANLARNAEIMDALDDVLSYFAQHGLYERYRNELCYLTVDHVLAVASVRVLRLDPTSELLGQFMAYTLAHFPDFRSNPYYTRMSAKKRLVFRLICRKQYKLAALLFKWQDKLRAAKRGQKP